MLKDIRRRPSGEPAPLPRPLASGKYWLAVYAAGIALLLLVVLTEWALRAVTSGDLAVLRALESLRAPWLTDVMRSLHALGSQWTLRALTWGTVAALVFFKRWRHLFVFLGAIVLVHSVVANASLLMARARPVGIDMIGDWDGFSYPSGPVASLSATLVGITYSMCPRGRVRNAAKWVIGALVVALALARLYLGVDHPTDVLAGIIGGVTLTLVAFRLITPNDVFPVNYRRARTAHLAIEGRRADAIKTAVGEQLGMIVLSVEPFHLAGSFGSTPLRIKVAGDPDTYLFAKLYASTHMRADRWYKLGRTLLYGRLEDEQPFSSVRRLVQYEDYLLRVTRDAGLPVAEPYGIVEIVPEREYLLVAEFIDDARESGEAEIDETVIDDALGVVRRMWDAGLAHRDIKPANVMVRGDKSVALIDLAFGQVRPSPWRQAADLANMMLVLAIRSTPELVYERALRLFTPQDIAEAFAATSEVTRPSLHKMMRSAGEDLVASFRKLAPPHPPIKVQRWSVRRLGLTAGVAFGGLLAILIVTSNLQSAGLM